MSLELEELRREQAGYQQQIQGVDEATKAIQELIDSMASTVAQNKVAQRYVVGGVGGHTIEPTRSGGGGHRVIDALAWSRHGGADRLGVAAGSRPNAEPLPLCDGVQEAVRSAQEKLSRQKEIIMAQDQEIKVTAFFNPLLCSNLSIYEVEPAVLSL